MAKVDAGYMGRIFRVFVFNGYNMHRTLRKMSVGVAHHKGGFHYVVVLYLVRYIYYLYAGNLAY